MSILPSGVVPVGYALLIVLGIWIWYRRSQRNRMKKELIVPNCETHPKIEETLPPTKADPNLSAYADIEPLPNFNWESTEPLKLRPFKPIFHLTMGLTNIPISSLLEIDKTYLARISLRKNLIRNHGSTVIRASPTIKRAVDELYTYLTSTYLPTRFPTMFQKRKGDLHNLATGDFLPLLPSSDPEKSLEILGENVDEDLLLLLPPKSEDDGAVEYRLQGYVVCFPSGFDTAKKFGMTLRDIHGPVPGYREKLARSMDRFFERLEVGKVVGRCNWAITTHDRLFVPSGNHLYADEEVPDEEVDLSNTHLRTERQNLWRLPKTKALVFSFKTYLYPLRDVKEEGLGEELATAIEGLKGGSVPGMWVYKRGVVWGEKVAEWLRS